MCSEVKKQVLMLPRQTHYWLNYLSDPYNKNVCVYVCVHAHAHRCTCPYAHVTWKPEFDVECHSLLLSTLFKDLTFILYTNWLIIYCVRHGRSMEGGRQFSGIVSILPSCGFQVSNSSCQAWQPGTLPAESTHLIFWDKVSQWTWCSPM